jgi:uncharacterized protein YecT (DUF1311 family)
MGIARILVLWLLLLGANAAVADASFDCAKARSKTERLICSNDELGRADRELAEAFGHVKEVISRRGDGSVDSKAFLVDDQRRWLPARDYQCEGNFLKAPATKAVFCLPEIQARIDWLRSPSKPWSDQNVAKLPAALTFSRIVVGWGPFSPERVIDHRIFYLEGPVRRGREYHPRAILLDPFTGRRRELKPLSSKFPLVHDVRYADETNVVEVQGNDLAVTASDVSKALRFRLTYGDQSILFVRILGNKLVAVERQPDPPDMQQLVVDPIQNMLVENNQAFETPLLLEEFDLKNRSLVVRRQGACAGQVQPWRDRIVSLTVRGEIVVCDKNLEIVATSKPFDARTFKPMSLPTFSVQEDRALIEAPLGKLVILDLNRMQVEQTIDLPNPDFWYSCQISEEFLFCLPIGLSRFIRASMATPTPTPESNTMSVFDLASATKVAEWNLVAQGFLIQNDQLATYIREVNENVFFTTYHVDRSKIAGSLR